MSKVGKIFSSALSLLLMTVVSTGCTGSSPTSVYRYDGSRQCEEGAISLSLMQQELESAGIDVRCAGSAHDGMARIAMCGAPTGKLHIFVISERDIDAAEALGFHSLTTLTEYSGDVCE